MPSDNKETHHAKLLPPAPLDHFISCQNWSAIVNKNFSGVLNAVSNKHMHGVMRFRSLSSSVCAGATLTINGLQVLFYSIEVDNLGMLDLPFAILSL